MSDKVYVTILSTDSYLPGVITLHSSLMKTKPKYKFLCLITPNISKNVRDMLFIFDIEILEIEPVTNPHNSNEKDRRYYNYSKLNMFGLTQFSKIVYIDADMVVLHNLDELFDKPNMSGTNAGGWIERTKDYKQLNSGLVVVEPNRVLFEDMLHKVGHIEKEKGKGDQAFLHSYFNQWPEHNELHLDHVYNLFFYDINAYKKAHGYYLDLKVRYNNDNYDPKRVKIIHYVGPRKPWNMVKTILKYEKDKMNTKQRSYLIWVHKFIEALNHKNIKMNEVLS
jgi:lipopolysaccharide biosynthesis glycosyltransferase